MSSDTCRWCGKTFGAHTGEAHPFQIVNMTGEQVSSDMPIDQPLKRAWLKATGAWITVQYDPVPGDDSDYRDIRGNRWRADELEIDAPRTWQSTLAEIRKQVVEVGYKPYRADMLFVLSVLGNHEKQLAALKAELAEERAAYDELVRLLKKRFPANPDGSLPDFKVEDVLAENARLREALNRIATEHLRSMEDAIQIAEEALASRGREENGFGNPVDAKVFCGYCGQWLGGPAECCKHVDEYEPITEAERDAGKYAAYEKAVQS